MTNLTLGVDAGNYKAKVAGPYGVDTYRTAVCDWFPRNVGESFGDDDMEFEIDGRRGYAGTVAFYEDQFGGGAMYGESKVHEDTKIRVLLAIHRYVIKYAPETTHISLVTGQPIKTHTPEEKEALVNLLKGTHQFTVDGISRVFTITDVGVAPEGSGAFWSNPQDGVVRIIDVGSGTVNAATTNDRRHIDSQSDTFNYGMETVRNASVIEMARAINRSTSELKWRKTDTVFICGGVASDILPLLLEQYQSARVLVPSLSVAGGYQETHEPVYANAIGFYELAKLAFG